jgi:hypothetical protein
MIKRIIKILTKIYKLIKYPHELFQLRNLLGITTINLMRYFVRLSMSKNFNNYIKIIIKAARQECFSSKFGGWVDSLNCYLIYFVVRHIQPKIVIETGVGPGSSSAFILKALEDNKNGVLYSIDLPGNDAIAYPKIGKNFNIHTPKGWSIGWFIPPWLKHRHKLIIGDSRKELPKVLNKINKKVDIFMHDSLHTDEHILMEFNTIFPYMGKRGILLCDDVKDSWSLAFIKFCETKKITYKVFDHRLGIAKLE